jgi:DNA repair exonuclease SbcCD nuclease subunit
VLIAPGNHDYCCPGSPWLEESWPENVTVFTGALESRAVEHLNLRIFGAGFTDMDCPSLLEGFRADCEETYTVALLHGDPAQANSPYNPVTAAQVRGSGLNYLALGHIHKAGSFRSGVTLCGWPGCPMGRGWDETGEKGIYLVELNPDSSEIHPIPLNSPRFLEETLDISGNAAAALEGALPPVPSSDFFRITLKGQGRVSLEELKNTFPHIPNLELRDQTEEPLDIWGDESADTLEGTYFRMLREKMDAADPKTAEQIRLAAEISRRLMEGREVVLP